MAKEDFCFTYYDGDAARDKAHMNRLERGAYDDIISAQRKRGHLLLEDIKRVLSKDFETCWASLEWILKKDEDGKYYIEWVDKSIDKMRRHSERQKENGRLGGRPKNPNETQTKPTGLKTETQLKPKPLKKETQTKHKKKPLEDGDGYEDGNKDVVGTGIENEDVFTNPFSEKFLIEWGRWKDYKRDEHGFKYKTPMSEQAAMNDLVKISKGDEVAATQIIRQSIANGWKGLFGLKNQSNGTTTGIRDSVQAEATKRYGNGQQTGNFGNTA